METLLEALKILRLHEYKKTDNINSVQSSLKSYTYGYKPCILRGYCMYFLGSFIMVLKHNIYD